MIPAASTATVSITKTETNEQVVSITAPNNGNNDVIRISPNLDKWLRYDWSNSGDFNEDPLATATFGVFTGHRYNIYTGQSHQ